MTMFTISLQTSILNKHLHELMDGLTAKVFRTYNASRTLQDQLNILTEGKLYKTILLCVIEIIVLYSA